MDKNRRSIMKALAALPMVPAIPMAAPGVLPTKNNSLYIQRFGRALRKAPRRGDTRITSHDTADVFYHPPGSLLYYDGKKWIPITNGRRIAT